MRVLVRKAVLGVLGAVLLCLPATAWAVPLDTDPAFEAIDQVTDLEPIPGLPTDHPHVIEAPRLSKNVASLQKELLVSIGHDMIVLEPNAPYEIFLDDVSLGTYTSDANGQLFVQVKIPSNTPTGSHILKVTDQKEINIRKTIAVVQ